MQIVAIHSGENEHNNALPLLEIMRPVFESQGIAYKYIDISGKCIGACDACDQCRENAYAYCEWGDASEWCYEAMRTADGIIIASTGTFGNAMPGIIGLMDKVAWLSQQASKNDPAKAPLRRKICTPLVAVENEGAEEAYMAILSICAMTQMIVPAAEAWSIADAANPSKTDDLEPRIVALAERMLWLMRKTTAA